MEGGGGRGGLVKGSKSMNSVIAFLAFLKEKKEGYCNKKQKNGVPAPPPIESIREINCILQCLYFLEATWRPTASIRAQESQADSHSNQTLPAELIQYILAK